MGSGTSLIIRKPTKVKPTNVARILDNYDTFLIDGDGILWCKNEHTDIPGIAESLKKLSTLGKRLIFVSNNSLYSRKNYRQKIKDRTDYLPPIDDIFPIDYAIAVYLTEILKLKGHSVYVVGRQCLADELHNVGVKPVGVGPDPDPVPLNTHDLLHLAVPNVRAVVVGVDWHFSYNKLFKAAGALTNAHQHCHFVASTQEKRVRVTNTRLAPVDGTFVVSIEAASGKEPVFVGKPNKYLYECIQKVHPEVKKSRTCMIAESPETDVVFARNVGIDSLLVLTGDADDTIWYNKTTFDPFGSGVIDHTPNYIIDSFGDLGRWL